ncbi:phosphate ABC transporter substrate-binding protein [Ruminiclostridium cellobioparum]|jgi:phosphate transport system substrate-binding protein|uniref:Phosphate-binding protein n=1 Tax=Ruminiclostridium cellobioparum subsp. termitidis CT1112 TaxID=1195236 RepID=S0FWU6_RUMCE|nr:phosphate ABC transporter substrate-binding protein [Ruminiclostridium cellobioparum]EMS73639.1 phosphate binding protein [Ruminiclostridium cellobioparum subsp. termitidis CT1112]
MKKLMKSVILSLALTMSLSTALVGCGSNNETAADSSASGSTQVESSASSSTEAAPSSTAGVSGSATAVGSSALQPLAEKAAQIFMETNKEANIQVQGGGSGTGLKQVSEGGADIGNSDVYAAEKLPEDQAKALVDHKVCVVGFATVVNPKVKVDNLTKQQLIDIFTGKITNWKDAGGDDMKIVIVNRPSSSGTRATFKKYALDGAEEAEGMALTEDQSGTVKKAIADTDGAISYLALSYVDSTVKALKYEGIEPKVENITSGSYPIWAYEHMYTKGEPTGVVKAFLDFMTSDEFKPTITELGYIPNSEMKVSRDN